MINDIGDVIFSVGFRDPGSYVVEDSASYRWANDAELVRLLGNGDVIETDRGEFSVSRVGVGGTNNRGYVSFLLNIDGPSKRIAISSEEGFRIVAADGDQIGNERIFYLSNRFEMSGSDLVVYEAAMIGGDAIPNLTRMILKNSPSEDPVVVARSLTQAPGAPEGVGFSPFFVDFAVNAHGQVAFSAALQDLVTGESKGRGIWAEDNMGNLRAVVQTGDIIDVDGGPGADLRQVSSIGHLVSGSNQGGLRSQFNDRGQVAFAATFSDGTSAILVSSGSAVPEPPAAQLVDHPLDRRPHPDGAGRTV